MLWFVWFSGATVEVYDKHSQVSRHYSERDFNQGYQGHREPSVLQGGVCSSQGGSPRALALSSSLLWFQSPHYGQGFSQLSHYKGFGKILTPVQWQCSVLGISNHRCRFQQARTGGLRRRGGRVRIWVGNDDDTAITDAKLGDKCLLLWKCCQHHDFSLCAWDLSCMPVVWEHVSERLKSDRRNLIKGIIKKLHIAPNQKPGKREDGEIGVRLDRGRNYWPVLGQVQSFSEESKPLDVTSRLADGTLPKQREGSPTCGMRNADL